MLELRTFDDLTEAQKEQVRLDRPWDDDRFRQHQFLVRPDGGVLKYLLPLDEHHDLRMSDERSIQVSMVHG